MCKLCAILNSFLLVFCANILLVLQLGAQVSGTVFYDFNENGVKDNFTIESPSPVNMASINVFNESGAGGVTITAYDSNNNVVGSPATSSYVDGTYTIPGVTGVVRVEFTWVSPGLYPSASGGTTVQFVNAPSANVDLGVLDPSYFAAIYSTTDPVTMDLPNVMYTSETNGDPLNGTDVANNTSIFMNPYNIELGEAMETGTDADPVANPIHVANAGQTGSVWGIALQRESNTLFSSAFMRRHMGLGPGSDGNGTHASGAIYTSDVSSTASFPNASFFFSLDQLGIATQANGTYNDVPFDKTNLVIGSNTDRQLSTDPGSPNVDPAAYAQVGRVSLGDIDISDDEEYLWIMNLYDKTIYRVFVDNPPVAPSAGDITPFSVTNPGCVGASADYYPWALKYHRGKVYYGVVCSEEEGSTSDNSNLTANVYELDPGTGSSILVLQFNLDFAKGCATEGPCSGTEAFWSNWNCTSTTDREHTSPILADIEFDIDGSMILGFADRMSKMKGYSNGAPDDDIGSPSTDESHYTNGDIYRAYLNPNTGIFELENNGTAGPNTTAGVGNGYGPGGGEYYWGDMKDGIYGSSHEEISLGGLAVLPGMNEVVLAAFDPTDIHSGGLLWLNNTTGDYERGYGATWAEDGDAAIEIYGKAGGFGDIELISDNPPIEIGNLVWTDTDADGIQDADESGISGVIVELLKDGNVIATAITDANGNYIFSNSSIGTTTASHIYNIGMLEANMEYMLRVPTSVAGDALTLVGQGSKNTIDSDANAAGEISVLAVDIPISGANNHSFDVGYSMAICDLTDLGKTNETCNDNGTMSDGSDDYITFSLNPMGSNLGSGYTVGVNNGGVISPTSGSYGSSTNFQLQTGSADGTLYTITITDDADPNCSITTSVQQNSCSMACDLTDSGVSNESCNDNGSTNGNDDYVTFSLNPSGTNTTTYSVTADNGGVVSLDGGGSPTGLAYGNSMDFRLQNGSADGTLFTITITDDGDPNCIIEASVSQNPCSNCPNPNCLNVQVQILEN